MNWYKKSKKLRAHHKVFFSLLIGFAVIAFWRGAWGLMDTLLFPNNYHLSSWVSLVIGLVILKSTHYLAKELL